MTRRVNKFETKIPTPIALSKKPNSRVDLETRLRKIDQEFQQDQDFAPSSSSTFMISNLKQELSHIKQDVEKLMMDDEYEQKPFKVETNSTLKQQLILQKQIEDQLRRQIKELKIRGNDVKLKEDRTVFMMKQIDVLKRQQDILQRQKEEALQTISKLKRELLSPRISQSSEMQLSDLKRRLQKQKQEKEQLQSARRRLEIENSNLIAELSFKMKEKEQYQGGVFQFKEEKNKMENEVARLKVSLSNALNNPQWYEERVKLDNEISRLKMQLVTSINVNDWKQQKSNLESEVSKYKLLSTSSGDQWKEQKIRMENEIVRLQTESKKSKQLLDTKYKSNKEEMISSINSIKDLTEKNYEFVRKINNIDSELSEKSEELRKKQQIVLQQKEEIRSITKEKDTRYNNLMSEFRKLEETLNKSVQENLIGMKSTIFSLETSIRTQQADKQKLKYTIAELTQRVQKLNFSLAEQKRQNQDLQQKLKTQIKISHEKQNKLQKRMSSKVEELSSEIISSKKQIFDKQSTISNFQTQIKNLETYKANQEKLKLIQIEQLNTSLDNNQLSSQIIKLKQTIQALQGQLIEKTKAIQRLSQANKQIDSSEIQRVETKYRQIVQDQKQIIEQNELVIMRQEKQISQLKQNSQKFQANSPKNSSFDDIFKDHIQQNEKLKLSIKNKIQQIFELKNQVQDYKRKVDFQKNQSEIDKLKNISDEKKIKNHYEIQIQNIQADIDSQKRKYDVLQVRLDTKVNELKKKDQFIQNVIINKVGKDSYPTELQYITKQLNKFFTGNYVDKLLMAEDQLKSLKQRLKGYQTR